jgi:hypothetical protein
MYTRGHARACGISEKLINRGPCPAAAVHSYRGSTRTTLTAASARAHSHTPRHSASARCEKRLSSHPLTFSVEPSHRNNQDRSQRPTPRSVFVLPTLWMSSRSLVRCSLSLSLMSPVLLVLSACVACDAWSPASPASPASHICVTCVACVVGARQHDADAR